jgi:hypothetical protein
MRRRRDRFRMDFRNGNDPAKAPGAAVIYPADNPNIIYDKEKDIIVNRLTGEWMKFNFTSREDKSFDASIMNNPKSPISVQGYFETYNTDTDVVTVKYNIMYINFSTDSGSKPSDYSIKNVAEFLRKYPGYYHELTRGRQVVVIDNHKSRGVA